LGPFFWLRFPFCLFAQSQVLDSITKLPLVGITITASQTDMVQITDEKGFFDVAKLHLTADKLVALTAIGYQRKAVTMKHLTKGGAILLKPVMV